MTFDSNHDPEQAQNASAAALAALVRFVLGRQLANRELRTREIGVAEGVPALGLDGLSSTAYGPEAALTILGAAGAAGLADLGPLMLAILVLLGILFVSYWQTIEAYPKSGGAYTVSQANLGVNASLLAAAALMIDYVLNVAVGISAGVAALVSAAPSLHPYTLSLCLGILVLLTLVNLRGTMDAGRLFAVPTYLFVACFGLVIAIGGCAAIASGGHPQAIVAPPTPPKPVEAVGLWLLLRAFASGCTAMTGVEAVSNGVSAFRQPQVRNARLTLSIIVATLGILLAGIAYLAMSYGVLAMDQTEPGYQSVLSQLVGAVAGHGVFYYVAIASALVILCLSANTSFVGFPQLCRTVAQDGFLPRPFAAVGRRLVYSVGILYLTLTAGVLLIVFDGITDRLIPLFAIGAFATFTMSQAGMVAHWRHVTGRRQDSRQNGQRRRANLKLIINAVGAAATLTALAVIVIAKFTEGGWITIIAIPCVILLLKAIKGYYDRVDAALHGDEQLRFRPSKPPFVLVMTKEWDRLTDKALSLAMEISPDVIAVHLAALEGADITEQERKLREQWAKDVEDSAVAANAAHPPRLVFLSAPFRRIHAPLLKLISDLESKDPERTIAVMIPELVKRHWWEYFLSNQRARRLRNAVLEYGGPRVVVIAVPWHLTPPKLAEALTEEELAEPMRIRNVFGFRRRDRSPTKAL
ncbi:MAG TPA: APC family permease [Xanthobacteraceae bacterium]|nr:APC family permease [Xanthobacteraceae bacterium]